MSIGRRVKKKKRQNCIAVSLCTHSWRGDISTPRVNGADNGARQSITSKWIVIRVPACDYLPVRRSGMKSKRPFRTIRCVMISRTNEKKTSRDRVQCGDPCEVMSRDGLCVTGPYNLVSGDARKINIMCKTISCSARFIKNELSRSTGFHGSREHKTNVETLFGIHNIHTHTMRVLFTLRVGETNIRINRFINSDKKKIKYEMTYRTLQIST